jgi:hypothetical protein
MAGLFIINTTLSQKGEASMKISQVAQKRNQNQAIDVAVDVHKDMLNFFFEAGGKEYSDKPLLKEFTVLLARSRGAAHRPRMLQMGGLAVSHHGGHFAQIDLNCMTLR